jgi:hypothetical protein
MHRSAGLVKGLAFGASASGESLFLRLEPQGDAASFEGKSLRVELLPSGRGGAPVATNLPLAPGVVGDGNLRVGLGQVLDVRFPCPPNSRAAIAFRVALVDGSGRVLETIPEDGWVRFRPPGPASSPGGLKKVAESPA